MDDRIKIIEYLPSFVASYSEIDEIMDDNQQELDPLWLIHKQTLDNNFVQDSDDYGASRYEKILRLTRNPIHSLDDRKFIILLNMNKELPYTIRTLRKTLTSILGDENAYILTVKHNEYALWLVLRIEYQSKFEEIKKMLHQVIPANLGLSSRLLMEAEPAHIYTVMHHTIATRITIAPYLLHDIDTTATAAAYAYTKCGMHITIYAKEEENASK